MISYLEGAVVFKGSRFVVVSAGGVGYKVFVAPETVRSIPEKSGSIKLWTHLHVREGSLELYGFLAFAELDFFELLISVPGVGPKSAVGILGVAPLDTLRKAIAVGETSYLIKVSGIGRRMAEKIVVELKEKLGGGAGGEALLGELRKEADALDALVSLGYSMKEARDALERVPRDVEGTEKRLQAALKVLGR